MVSYEITFSLFFIVLILISNSTDFEGITTFNNFSDVLLNVSFLVILYIVIMFAETNRAPFDLPEAEAELVAGYNVEYSSAGFILFYLGEYVNMFFMSLLISP